MKEIEWKMKKQKEKEIEKERIKQELKEKYENTKNKLMQRC